MAQRPPDTAWLQGNFIGPAGMRELSAALEGNLTVTTLDVSGNRLGVEGGKELASLLTANQHLKNVYASGNNLDNEGVAALAEALRTNGKLPPFLGDYRRPNESALANTPRQRL